MKQSTKKKVVAFYEGNAWVHRVKLLQPDGSVKYSKRGGFQSEAEAEASYYKYEKEYKKATSDVGKAKSRCGFKRLSALLV